MMMQIMVIMRMMTVKTVFSMTSGMCKGLLDKNICGPYDVNADDDDNNDQDDMNKDDDEVEDGVDGECDE